MHSKKLNVQLLVQALQFAEIQDVVISPGSRNAPLILEFSENDYFQNYSIIDERSAGFFALGLSQQSHKPTVLCCTSGSAVANYYPAVTEAFYQNIQLIIISADRPEHFTDIFDGQTIRQQDIFKNHSHADIQLKEDESTESMSENFSLIKKAISLAIAKKGPVHINMPFDEPLYETTENLEVEVDNMQIANQEFKALDYTAVQNHWNSFDKKMMLCGMLPNDKELQQSIYQFAKDENIVILSESTSNLNHPNIFEHIDSIVFGMNDADFESFAPDILLTVGQNVVSKKIKQLIRNSNLKEHWHLDEHWSADTFFKLTKFIHQPKTAFLNNFYQASESSIYFHNWKKLKEQRESEQVEKLKNTPFSDLKVYQYLAKSLPDNSALQFGNSSAIRYSQLFDFNKFAPINANRGTSGIEGSLATAIGAANNISQPTVLIVGDISFFYESNSLWNSYIPDNFKIVLINNQGGEIFNFIPGPNSIPQKSKFLTTNHSRNAKNIAKEFDLNYFYANDFQSLENTFESFLNSTKPAILEIETSKADNSNLLKNYLS